MQSLNEQLNSKQKREMKWKMIIVDKEIIKDKKTGLLRRGDQSVQI